MCDMADAIFEDKGDVIDMLPLHNFAPHVFYHVKTVVHQVSQASSRISSLIFKKPVL